MTDTITAPDTIFYAGQWRPAHWCPEVVDPSTGELLVSATLASPPYEVVVLRLTMELVRDLRKLAGLTNIRS